MANFKDQQGSALIISLIILLLVTILGVSSMQGTTTQERMAGNTRQVHLSFNAAESGVKAIELIIEDDSITKEHIDCYGFVQRFFADEENSDDEKGIIEADLKIPTGNDNNPGQMLGQYKSGYCRSTPTFPGADTGLDTTSGSAGEVSRDVFTIVSRGSIGTPPEDVRTDLIVTYEFID